MTLPDPNTEPFINGGAERVAEILGITTRHAYTCIKKGEIPSVRIGSRIRIPTRRFLVQFGLLEEATAAHEAEPIPTA